MLSIKLNEMTKPNGMFKQNRQQRQQPIDRKGKKSIARRKENSMDCAFFISLPIQIDWNGTCNHVDSKRTKSQMKYWSHFYLSKWLCFCSRSLMYLLWTVAAPAAAFFPLLHSFTCFPHLNFTFNSMRSYAAACAFPISLERKN